MTTQWPKRTCQRKRYQGIYFLLCVLMLPPCQKKRLSTPNTEHSRSQQSDRLNRRENQHERPNKYVQRILLYLYSKLEANRGENIAEWKQAPEKRWADWPKNGAISATPEKKKKNPRRKAIVKKSCIFRRLKKRKKKKILNMPFF